MSLDKDYWLHIGEKTCDAFLAKCQAQADHASASSLPPILVNPLAEENAMLKMQLVQCKLAIDNLEQTMHTMVKPNKMMAAGQKVIDFSAQVLGHNLLDYFRSVVMTTQPPWDHLHFESWQKKMWAETYEQFCHGLQRMQEIPHLSLPDEKTILERLKIELVGIFNTHAEKIFSIYGRIGFQEKTVQQLNRKHSQNRPRPGQKSNKRQKTSKYN